MIAYRHLRKLPPAIRKAALDNCATSDWLYCAHDEADNLNDALMGLFVWEKSPQGWDYWAYVAATFGNTEKKQTQ